MYISNIITQFSNHLLHNISTVNSYDIEEGGPNIKLDSRSESPVVVSHSSIIHLTGKWVSVSEFTNYLVKPIMVAVVHAYVDYGFEYTG